MNNFSNQQPGGRQAKSKMPTAQKVTQQAGGQFSSEFAQDNNVPLVAKRVQQSAQNKIQDNFKTPNEKFSSEFASETQGTLRQKAQQSKHSKIQDNYKTPNEKFDEGFDS
ncbi:gamma-type small acid-soluble spore protein [Paenibacillus medicaginis]|uniref:Small, acid-soluble spore protein gamma-type n=1 Tax=Paenibacillus medicaginis TaxID=1470560 RepID=A0ABV5C144_9BACL